MGASRALWIAEKSGMPEDVLSEAKDFLNTGIFPLRQASIKFKNKQKKLSLYLFLKKVIESKCQNITKKSSSTRTLI